MLCPKLFQLSQLQSLEFNRIIHQASFALNKCNLIWTLLYPQSPIYALSFSIEGRFLVSGGADCRLLLWDLAHGHLLAELLGHTATIYSLAFSRDGHILTSGKFKSHCHQI